MLEIFPEGPQDTDHVVQIFASACVAAGTDCSLNTEFNFTSGNALLAKIDSTIDALYQQSVPVSSTTEGIATAANLRGLLTTAAYSISLWPLAADLLTSAFKGDFTGIVDFTLPPILPEDAKQPDRAMFATEAIAVSISVLCLLPLLIVRWLVCRHESILQ